jgi:cellulose synthase/poly-beta-1,6-N-acetylglucosamine synthase-like glycosyltransferase
MLLMPINHMMQNSLYYSGKAPKHLLYDLPHISVVIPVYKESLSEVLAPTIVSLSKAVQTYELQGGTANIIICEDGLQIVDDVERKAREDFYDEHHCSWVARHPKGRAGRFKKSSNLNVMHRLSLKIEDIMATQRPDTAQVSWNQEKEDILYYSALEEALQSQEGTWAAGNIRIGDYILLLDSDTRIPEDCLLDAASEMESSPGMSKPIDL